MTSQPAPTDLVHGAVIGAAAVVFLIGMLVRRVRGAVPAAASGAGTAVLAASIYLANAGQ